MNETDLDDNRWKRLKDAFNEAVKLTPESRLAYFSALSVDEKTLYRELAGLIEIDAQAEDFLDEPAALETDPPPPLIGETIGQYRIMREVERGGDFADRGRYSRGSLADI